MSVFREILLTWIIAIYAFFSLTQIILYLDKPMTL